MWNECLNSLQRLLREEKEKTDTDEITGTARHSGIPKSECPLQNTHHYPVLNDRIKKAARLVGLALDSWDSDDTWDLICAVVDRVPNDPFGETHLFAAKTLLARIPAPDETKLSPNHTMTLLDWRRREKSGVAPKAEFAKAITLRKAYLVGLYKRNSIRIFDHGTKQLRSIAAALLDAMLSELEARGQRHSQPLEPSQNPTTEQLEAFSDPGPDAMRPRADSHTLTLAAVPEVSLASLLPLSRIEYDPTPAAFADLEQFVDGDEVTAQLVAAVLKLPDSPSFEEVSAQLSTRLEQTINSEMVTDPRSYAALLFLFDRLDERQDEALFPFMLLPKAMSLPLEFLVSYGEAGISPEVLVDLIALGLLEEASEERYRLASRLMDRIPTALQAMLAGEDGVEVLQDQLIAYYKPRFEDVLVTLELELLGRSSTQRRRAGYRDDSMSPLDAATARAWWETESATALALYRWSDGPDDLDHLGKTVPTLLCSQRIARVVAAENAEEYLVWLKAEHDEGFFRSKGLEEKFAEIDEALAALTPEEIEAANVSEDMKRGAFGRLQTEQ